MRLTNVKENYIYIYIYTCMHTYIHIYIYTHTRKTSSVRIGRRSHLKLLRLSTASFYELLCFQAIVFCRDACDKEKCSGQENYGSAESLISLLVRERRLAQAPRDEGPSLPCALELVKPRRHVSTSSMKKQISACSFLGRIRPCIRSTRSWFLEVRGRRRASLSGTQPVP